MPSDIRPLTRIVINGIEYSIADEIVQELLGVIYENNTAVAERINDLNDRVLNNYSYIQSINGTLTKSDWNESDSTSYAYILNKPDITVNQYGDMNIESGRNIDINSNDIGTITLTSSNGITINGVSGIHLNANSNYINFDSGPENDQLKIYGSEGVFIESANNKNISITTSGTGKLKYNDKEVATVDKIVQSDWNESNSTSYSYILNKPIISTSVIENDTNAVSGGAVYSKIEDLIGAAPEALDTLEEIATALNNDEDLAGTLTTQISSKISKVENPTTGNFAYLLSDGTIGDSGHKHSDYLTSHQDIKTINNQTITGTGNITIQEGVKSDWNESDSTSYAYILNKPIIPALVKSDWNETNVNSYSYIQNKPTIPTGLPTVTSSDNGKILMVVNGQWTLVSPSVLYSGSGIPNNFQGNNGDLYVQTNE